MEEQLTNSKEQFVKGIVNFIKMFEFISSENNENLYIRSVIVPGRTMQISINGQEMHQQEPPTQINLICELFGFGSIDENEFAEVWFKIEQNENTQLDHIECFYFNELEIFKNFFHEIFKI